MTEPPELSLRKLSRQGLTDRAIEIAVRMTNCIMLAADTVAADTDDEVSYDDASGRGFLLYRRARKRIIEELRNESDVEIRTPRNTLQVLVDGILFSFYSAPNGVDHPMLTGSTTKKAVVDHMQLQMETNEEVESLRLVLMHNADEDGLVETCLGVMRSKSEWEWQVPMFGRFSVAGGTDVESATPAYDQQEEAQLPAITRRQETDMDEGTASTG